LTFVPGRNADKGVMPTSAICGAAAFSWETSSFFA